MAHESARECVAPTVRLVQFLGATASVALISNVSYLQYRSSSEDQDIDDLFGMFDEPFGTVLRLTAVGIASAGLLARWLPCPRRPAASRRRAGSWVVATSTSSL